MISPFSCNLTAFHVLFSDISCALKFNYTSGLLAHNMDAWNIDQGEGGGLYLLGETLNKKIFPRSAVTSPTNNEADGATIALSIDENKTFLSLQHNG